MAKKHMESSCKASKMAKGMKKEEPKEMKKEEHKKKK
jgi:hypothetical protein